jgi:hypothetical protein
MSGRLSSRLTTENISLVDLTGMTLKKYIIGFIVAVLNSFIFIIIPNYLFAFIILIPIWAAVCLVIIGIDLFEKTRLWIGALYGLALAILSFILGYYMEGRIQPPF